MYTSLTNVLTGVGFALILTACFALSGRPVIGQTGVLWGLGGSQSSAWRCAGPAARSSRHDDGRTDGQTIVVVPLRGTNGRRHLGDDLPKRRRVVRRRNRANRPAASNRCAGPGSSGRSRTSGAGSSFRFRVAGDSRHILVHHRLAGRNVLESSRGRRRLKSAAFFEAVLRSFAARNRIKADLVIMGGRLASRGFFAPDSSLRG